MATRKRNEWLDADESEEEERSYESEDEGRAHLLKSKSKSKRQKLQHDSGSEDEDESHDEDDNLSEADDQGDLNVREVDSYPDSPSAELAHLEKLAANLPAALKLKSGALSGSLPTKPKKDKSGVIYLSRVPPFMKPTVLRSLLTPYGAIGRIFLTPEPTTTRQQRLKSGGTRRKLFLDGWVEFLHKKDAKHVADALNAQIMGGKKRSRWHDEVWNIRYLNGVKWAHLVEQIQNENAERAARLRLEIAKDKKENAKFLENVEMGKMISGIAAKRKEKGIDVGGGEEEADSLAQDGDVPSKPAKRERRSKFQQREIKTKTEKKPEPGQDVQKVLSSIF